MVGPEKIREIAEELVGTCKSLSECLRGFELTEDDLSTADYAELDAWAWLCDQCGWWVEPSEINDENVCEECAADEDEEDEEADDEE